MISCIIPAYNAERSLGRAVASIRGCELESAELEIVIVDDGSADSTYQIGQELARQDATIKVVQQPGGRNRGAACARNLGIEQSRGDLICFLDADDTVLPNRFRSPVRVLAENPDVDAVYSLCKIAVEDQSQHADWNDGGVFGLVEPLVGVRLMESLIQGTPWSMSAVLVRRSLLQKTGLFSEKFRTAEDCHLWLRMAAIGKVVPDPSRAPVSLYHRRSGSLFSHGIANKVNYLEVLFDFLKWTESNSQLLYAASNIRELIASFLDRSLVTCREAGRSDLVWSLFVRSLLHEPVMGLTLRNINHVLRTHLDRKASVPSGNL